MSSVSVDRRGVARISNTGALRGANVINATGVEIPEIVGSLQSDPQMAAMVDALSAWHQRTTQRYDAAPTRNGGILDRDRYVTPHHYYGRVRTARMALSDVVVGGAADGSEALAIKRASIVTADTDEENAWNQMADDLDLVGVLKKGWRTLYTDSAVVFGVWWGRESYKVEGTTKAGNARRKPFNDLIVPQAMTVLDTAKIAPVGSIAFGQEMLAYVADPLEAMAFDAIIAKRGEGISSADVATRNLADFLGGSHDGSLFLGDTVISRLVLGRYEPVGFERDELIADGISDITNLFLLDPRSVFRVSSTRQDYRRFPDVRLESCFQLLDLKAQVRQSDRAQLMGSASFILLITKGTDKHPVEDQSEIDNLRANAQVLASMPVITGDHRLKVEIITPKTDMTLRRDKHDTLDSRLFARAWGTFVPTGADANDDPMKLGRVIGRGLESRRSGLTEAIERRVLRVMWKANEALKRVMC